MLFRQSKLLGRMVNRGLERHFLNVQIYSYLYSNLLTSIQICLNPFNFKQVVFFKIYLNTTPHCKTKLKPHYTISTRQNHIRPHQTSPNHTIQRADNTEPYHTTTSKTKTNNTKPNQTQQSHRPRSEFKTKVQF
jgi:hypothetical protein